MKQPLNTERRSFVSITWKIVVGFSVILTAFLAVNMAAGYFIKRQMQGSLESAAGSYLTALDRRFIEINDHLANLAIVDADVDSIRYTEDVMTLIQSSQRVNEKLNFYRENTRGNFRYFIYYQEKEYFNTSDRGELGIREAAQLNQEILHFLEKDYAKRNFSMQKKWKMIKVGKEWYALNYIFYGGCYACCYILADDLAESVPLIDLGDSSRLIFMSEENEPYHQKEELIEEGIYRENEKNGQLSRESFGYRYALMRSELKYAEFAVALIVWNQNDISASFLMQTIFVVILLLGVLGLILCAVYTRNYLLRPILYFFKNLESLENEENNVYFENSRIQELWQANQLYRRILEQVRLLKIQVYEKTIEQQKTQIEYLQLQIQPHFYINCMNLIYNMSCMGDEEGVQMMARYVSDYFRYIFRCSQGEAELSGELSHVRNYLEICRLRYRMKLEYRVEQGEGLERVKIPPLLLHTFVENSVKYGGSSSGEVKVEIRAKRIEMEEQEFVVIELTDEGKGFPEEILNHLAGKEDIITERGNRVGIVNTIRRMEHIYGEHFHITFFNKKSGGAMVRISIPVQDAVQDPEVSE